MANNCGRTRRLVAYYTFESAGRSNAVLPNLSAAGSALDGQVDGAEWVYGRFPGKYALYFHGPGSGDKVVLPEHRTIQVHRPVLGGRVVQGRAVHRDVSHTGYQRGHLLATASRQADEADQF